MGCFQEISSQLLHVLIFLIYWLGQKQCTETHDSFEAESATPSGEEGNGLVAASIHTTQTLEVNWEVKHCIAAKECLWHFRTEGDSISGPAPSHQEGEVLWGKQRRKEGGMCGAAAVGCGSAALQEGELWLCWLPMAFLPPGELTFPEMKSEQAE